MTLTWSLLWCSPPPLQYAADDLPPDQATLWFAGKQMLPDKKLSEYVGRHEKTKAVVKLQKKGQGAPAREPVGACVVCGCHQGMSETQGRGQERSGEREGVAGAQGAREVLGVESGC